LSVPPLFESQDPRAYYFLFLALMLVCVLAMHVLVSSPLGAFMRAIKDDDLRAETLGIDTTRIKVLAFTVSSSIAGLAGAFYAHYVVVLSPQIADFSEMAKLIVMVVVGGLGTFAGPLIATAPVQILSSYVAKYQEWSLVIFALVVIFVMRTQVGGIVALGEALWRRVRPR
jgi:branched-chain amino acid transport system permease protein